MDNFMHRGGRMLGSSKSYGSNRPQGNEWRSENSRMLDASRPYKESQIPETSRQREGFRMQDSRLLMESVLEPPRIYNVSEVQGSGRILDRAHGGTQLQREVRVHQDSRMESSNRLQENSRMYDMPQQDHLEPRSSTVAYDYNHRQSNDADSFKDIGTLSKFMNSHENMRSGRNYIVEENESAKQEFLGTLPKNNSLKKNLDLLSAQSRHGSVITPGSSHILTPSLTTSPGQQTNIGMRPIGSRDLYPKEKSSKAFDYLKTWRRKMNMPTDSFLLEKEGIVGNQQQGVDVMPPLACDDWYTQPPTTEPRRASIDPEWNCSGNSFADKDTYGERLGNKYGNRYGSYGESLVDCPKGQSLESDRTGNPPWKWAEELPSGQNEGAKRNYENMALGQTFNHANRDGRLLHDTVQPKRPRMSPSIMESERRGTMEQYTSVISEQPNLSPLGRHKYTELQDQASRFSGQGAPQAPRPISTGQQRSPSTQERAAVPKGERSSEFGRVKPSAPRRGRSPVHQTRERSPGLTRRERLPASPERGRLLDNGRWSPARLPAHSGREKSPEPFRRERPPSSAERRKSPLLLGEGTSHGLSSVGERSSGALGGQSSRPLERGRPTGKSHAGRRSSPGASEKGKLPSEMSSKPGRGKSPGPERRRSSEVPGRARSPGTEGSYRLPRLPGKGKETDGPGRRSPRQLNTGKPSKTVKGGSTEQQQPRYVSAVTGVSVDRKVAEGEQSRSSHHSRGRSPMKGRSPVGTRMRSESFRDGKQRPRMERFPRIRNRSAQSPVKRISSDHRGKNEALYPSEYKDYKMKNDRSPYLEEVSLSPRASRCLSPTGREIMNIRSHHSRERSLSVDALKRECSPVSVQSEDNQHQNINPQEPVFADRKRAAAKRKSTVKPLMVTSGDFTNSDDIRKEVENDATLQGLHKRMQENSVIRLNDNHINFVKQRGMIYRQIITPSGERKLQLVLPVKYRDAVLKLGHSNALGVHMGRGQTRSRVETYFFWPGIGQEVSRFVKTCEVCQKNRAKGMVRPTTLQELPRIDSSFERVAIDLVGPIEPRASDGSRYILTLVDLATHWTEAVPLKNFKTQTVVEALMTIFCRLGMPKEIQSDRRSRFTSAMMKEVLRLIACKGLRTTSYNTMENRLCKHLNATLTKILKCMVAEQPKEWPRYLAPLLFVYREVPQSCTRFSPLKLMCGTSVMGPLQLLRELWDDYVPDPTVKNTYQYVLDLGDKLRETCNIVKETCNIVNLELSKTKRVQKGNHDRKGKLRKFRVGEQCLVFLPATSNKLLAQWKGPYDVQEKVSNIFYMVMVDGHPERFYINTLKQYARPKAATGGLRERGYDVEKVGAAVGINDDEDEEAPLTVMKLGEELAPELGTIALLLESYADSFN